MFHRQEKCCVWRKEEKRGWTKKNKNQLNILSSSRFLSPSGACMYSLTASIAYKRWTKAEGRREREVSSARERGLIDDFRIRIDIPWGQEGTVCMDRLNMECDNKTQSTRREEESDGHKSVMWGRDVCVIPLRQLASSTFKEGVHGLLMCLVSDLVSFAPHIFLIIHEQTRSRMLVWLAESLIQYEWREKEAWVEISVRCSSISTGSC